MKTGPSSLLSKSATLAFGFMLANGISAQTFKTLHSFTAGAGGSSPYDGLVLDGNILYGTTYFEGFDWGATAQGNVFAMSTDGLPFGTLHSFPLFNELTPTNIDGDGVFAGLTRSGSRLYGTTVLGGNLGNGTVFALNTDGTGFTVLHNFNSSSDGGEPHGRLVLSGKALYGTAIHGGSTGNGTIFALSTDGTGFTVLHTFAGGNEGANPYGTLILSSNTLYGTAAFGAGVDPVSGTVFSLSVDGTSFKVLHTFTASTFSDGNEPLAGLILSGTTLYGEASYGGSGGSGTVFAMKTDGTGFTNLYNFTAIPPQHPQGGSLPATNSDGAVPQGALIVSNNTLYGSTARGGTFGQGTVFAISTDGTGFTVLHDFKGSSDGSAPNGGLVLLGNTLYGTACFGGSSGDGTVFSISFSPRPTIIHSGSNVILSWPTNYAGFDYSGYTLQSTKNIALSVWTNNPSAAVVVNGQYIFTNSISVAPQFFRLSQ